MLVVMLTLVPLVSTFATPANVLLLVRLESSAEASTWWWVKRRCCYGVASFAFNGIVRFFLQEMWNEADNRLAAQDDHELPVSIWYII
jgi:hypothetical protein